MPRTLKNAERVEVSPDAILAQSLHTKREGELFRRENKEER